MTATFYVGDAVATMNRLPEKSVDLVLTSPPFLALRSYLPADHPDKELEGGSQATPGEYIDWLLDVVEACDRVLAPHGSLCIELGDTYSGSGGGGGDYVEGGRREGQAQFAGSAASMRESNAAHWRQKNQKGKLAEYSDARGNPDGMRDTTFSGGNTRTGGGTGWPLAKSLSLIPESFRWAMVYGHNPHTGRQTEPWRLRNVIRWVRPNPPVGALGDKFRPATSELMVFCKSAKRYFDLDAVRQEPSPNTHRRNAAGTDVRPNSIPSGQRDGNWSTLPISDLPNPSGAPPLDWWNIPPGGYEGAHYAVWPPELCVKPVKAMCPSRVCRVCGEPSRRVSEAGVARLSGAVLREAREAAGLTRAEVGAWWGGGANNVWDYEEGGHVPPRDRWDQLKAGLGIGDEYDYLIPEAAYEYVNSDLGGLSQNASGELYRRLTSRQNRIAPDRFTDCGHDDWRPGLVLDPFAGSGTTLAVATGHGRDAIGIDLDERNYELALDRVGPLVLSRGEIAA